MGVGRVPPAVGVAGELGWIASSGSLNGGFGPSVVDEVAEVELGGM